VGDVESEHEVKDGVLITRRKASGQGGAKAYLKWLAVHEPRVMGALLIRTMPQQARVTVDTRTQITYRSIEDVKVELREIGIDVHKLVEPEDEIEEMERAEAA
jgi:hypothetical protein